MAEDGVTPLAPNPACPLPIAVLAGFSLISVCCVPIIFVLPVPVPLVLFGHAISGRPALVVFGLMSLTLAVSAVGLLQLKRWSYPLTIGYHLFWCLNATVAFVNPKTRTIMNDALDKVHTPGYPGSAFSYSHNQYLAVSTGGLLFVIAILVSWCSTTAARFMRNATAREIGRLQRPFRQQPLRPRRQHSRHNCALDPVVFRLSTASKHSVCGNRCLTEPGGDETSLAVVFFTSHRRCPRLITPFHGVRYGIL